MQFRQRTTESVVTSDIQTLDQRKAALRAAALARRDAMPAAERQAAANTVAARPFPFPLVLRIGRA